MAEATKQTERVETVTYEDKDFVTVKMTVEEAAAVHSALWLIEMEAMENPDYMAMKGVQDALLVALEFPLAKFRFDKGHRYNNESSVYIRPRD